MAYMQVYGLVHTGSSVTERGSISPLTFQGDAASFRLDINTRSSVPFKKLFGLETKPDDIFQNVVAKMVQTCLGGFNVSLVLVGGCRAPFNKILFGENENLFPAEETNCGILSDILKHLFQYTGQTVTNASQSRMSKMSKATTTLNEIYEKKLSLCCFGIEQEEILDFLRNFKADAVSGRKSTINGSSFSISLPPTAGEVKNTISTLLVQDVRSGLLALQTAMERRNRDNSAFVVEFYVTYPCTMVSDPQRSCFQVIQVPSIEALLERDEDSHQDYSNSNKGVLAFQDLLHYLAESMENFNPPYYNSLLTSRMTNAVGGNAFTSVLVALEEHYSSLTPLLFSLVSSASKIKNFPITNTLYSQGLLNLYEKKYETLTEIIRAEKNANSTYTEELRKEISVLQRSVQRLEVDKDRLLDENSSLKEEVMEMKKKFTEEVVSKTRLSSRMVVSEEEKLQMSKDAVELQLENNKIKQDTERCLFDLKSKCASLQDSTKTLERQLALEKRKSQDLQEELDYLRREHKDLTNEYVNIKYNHNTLTETYERQVAERGKLIHDIENLMCSKEELLRGRDCTEITTIQRFQERLKAITEKAELNMDHTEVSPSIAENNRIRTTTDIEKQLLLSNEERAEKLENLRLLHNKDLEDCEKRIEELRTRMTEAEERNHRYKLKIAEQNGENIVLQDKNDYLESSCQSQSTKIDQISTEYMQRLQDYIQDLKGYLAAQVSENSDNSKLVDTLDCMLNDLKKGYHSRYEELESRMNKTVTHLDDIYASKEKLLASYKMLLWKIDEKETGDFAVNNLEIPLPPDSEIRLSQVKERNELHTKLHFAEDTIRELTVKVDHLKKQIAEKEQRLNDILQGRKMHKGMVEVGEKAGPIDLHSIQNQMREFTLNTQYELEQERADLMTRCQLAEQQLVECQTYIDTNVKRYQEEITHLRKLLQTYSQTREPEVNYSHDLEPRAILPPLNREHGRHYFK